jgi:hypothetical protein
MAEREEQDAEAAATTEELMKTAPPPSVLGDVEDAVAPEVDGEQTPWSPPGQDDEVGEG